MPAVSSPVCAWDALDSLLAHFTRLQRGSSGDLGDARDRRFALIVLLHVLDAPADVRRRRLLIADDDFLVPGSQGVFFRLLALLLCAPHPVLDWLVHDDGAAYTFQHGDSVFRFARYRLPSCPSEWYFGKTHFHDVPRLASI